PQFQSFRGHTLECTIEPEIKENIIKLCKQTGTTEYMVLLSAFMVLLREYSHQEDIVVGSPFSGRVHPDTEKILGMFVNTLVMRGKPQGDKSFHTFLEEMKEKCLQAQANQEYALEELIENLDLVRDSSRNPLFDVMFNIQNMVDLECDFEEFGFKEISWSKNVAKFDLTVTLTATKHGYGLSFEYRTDLFNKNSIDQMMAHYVQILKEITQNPTRKIIDINVVSPTEKEKILDEFNDVSLSTPLDKNIVTRFEDQVSQTPDKVAVCADGKEITYQELNAKANELAVRLREMGIGRDDYVAIMAERNIETIIGICGIIKAGGAYVPVDPAYPLERVTYMLEDCKPKAILVNGSSFIYKEDIPVVDVSEAMQWTGRQENPVNINTVDDLINLIYTSGTTGKPKGVMIEHKGVTRLVHRPNYVELNKDTVILQTGSLSFDAATFEIWGALLNGGKLRISSQDLIMDASKLKQTIARHKINTMFLTTALFNQLINSDVTVFDGIGTLLFGGEKASEVHVRKLLENNSHIQLTNLYGPTETTTFATYYPIDVDQLRAKTPIGKPISNTATYIMNEGRLCGIGMVGELCIAGDGVARGYLNKPELTKAKFIPNPYGPEMMYCSGDLARWLPDGNIEYLDRIDDQVKLRGFRIELGEIESVIRKVDNVKEVAVVVSERDNEQHLCAYIVGRNILDVAIIRSKIGKELPSYMIPAYMMQIDEIPLTINGKVDKEALPEIEAKSNEEYVAPRNKIEEKILNVFANVLGVKKIGLTDSFYELGGDSIRAIRVVSKLRELAIELSIRDIMQMRVMDSILKKAKSAELKVKYEQEEVVGNVPLTPIQKIFFDWKLPNVNHFNQAVMLKAKGELEEQLVRKTLREITVHHDLLRATFIEEEQVIRKAEDIEAFHLETYNFMNIVDKSVLAKLIRDENNKLQSSIDITSGPLLKAALYRTIEGNYLMICIHHLVIDGVSWRIIIEDLVNGYKQASARQHIKLPEKTASYLDWSQGLLEYSKCMELESEIEYWTRVCKKMELGRISEDSIGEEGFGSTTILFDRETTQGLLYEANKAYNTEINDILLVTLGLAVKSWKGQKSIGIHLEGHGREEIHKDINISRTVGWFTSIYPVLLEIPNDIEEAIIQVKETLRHIPNHGLGFGVIQNYRKDRIYENDADICFNYLGQWNDEEKENIKINLTSDWDCGRTIAGENKLKNGITITGIVKDDQLSISILFDKAKYNTESINLLNVEYEKALRGVVEFCASKQEGVKTVSDYNEDLTAEVLQEILEIF
ncbi:amino acid adenylation domain-containing protein, partial [Bacillus spizizenii]|uniref:amino acid adenylation domain-containing protein n=1 Tax=Bacillus spizizenii TaxID=96241 RepID=UPI002DBBA28B